VPAREYRTARSRTVGTALFAVFFSGLGVLGLVVGAMGWAPPNGVSYAAGAGVLVPGWLAALSLRKATRADAAGLRLRGMFRTRVVPWSHVRYIHVRPSRGAESGAPPRGVPVIGNGDWVVQAGLVDGTVTLPGTAGRAGRARQFAAGLTADHPGPPWLAIGLDLTAIPADGRPQTPLLVTEPLHYRASWELPGLAGTSQAGAPLLCSSASTLAPGDSARAVILPLTGAHLSQWRLLSPGDQLRLLDGPQVRGHAVVRWSQNTSLPVPSTDTNRFSLWASSSDDLPGPA
jgi:hypothetical protein